MNRAPRPASLAVIVALGMASMAAAGQVAAPERGRVEAQAGPLPRVHLVATGGTISNKVGGRLSAAELIQSIPALGQYVRPESEQFANVASAQLTLDQWLDLSRRINDLLSEPDLAGVVVTSGTDTLEETAYWLHLTVRSEKPVVVVGSMRNPSTLGYEGAANLLEGFRVAAAPDSRGKGVLVVLNDEINSAREVTKTDALRLQTFQTRGYGLLGVVDSDRVAYYRAPIKRHTSRSEFDVRRIQRLPRVDVLMAYQGASGDLIKAAAASGAEGIVMATAGAGALSGDQPDALRTVMDHGTIVVTTTRTGSGRITPSPRRTDADAGGQAQGASQPPAGGPRRPNFIAGEDLAPVKARILLMLALTVTRDPAELQRIFSEY